MSPAANSPGTEVRWNWSTNSPSGASGLGTAAAELCCQRRPLVQRRRDERSAPRQLGAVGELDCAQVPTGRHEPCDWARVDGHPGGVQLLALTVVEVVG